MTLAAFLPKSAAEHVESALPSEEILFGRSWKELDAIIGQPLVTVAMIDPGADGTPNKSAVINLMARHPAVSFMAYVSLTNSNLKATADLSRHGLASAILHPLGDSLNRFWSILDHLSANPIVRGFLGTIEPALGRLPHPTVRAVQDLFERPHRYQAAADLALQSGMTVREVYRDFESAKLGTPKKLVTAAKVLRGFGYVKRSRFTVSEITRKIGFSNPRVFGEHTRAIFGCRPSELRADWDIDEIVRQVLEWFYRPSERTRSPATSMT